MTVVPQSSHGDESEDEQEQFKPLSAQEAQAWRQRHKQISLGYLLIGQTLVGVLIALIVWALAGLEAAYSAAYGALAVLFPAAVFARALVRRPLALQSGGAAAATAGLAYLFAWEAVKLVLSVVMLVLAPKVIVGLNWLALLSAVVLVSKTHWLAWWYWRAKS